ncbi:response regulator transcription factor [Pleionea sediminis]|uniref:response regulator transcription factor n=1 Tax=Pleionea sediminis TaxID=2569479 RepID=UPI0011864F3A|nr:response regulator [Pleionea sediminis]
MLDSETWLVIDDDHAFSDMLAKRLQQFVKYVFVESDAFGARQLLNREKISKVVLDLKLSNESGLDVLEDILIIQPSCRVLVLTGYASISTAVLAIKKGAYNYLPKPASSRQIIEALGDDISQTLVTEDRLTTEELEWEHIQKVLNDHDGNISATARALDMHRRTLQRKLAKKRVIKKAP